MTKEQFLALPPIVALGLVYDMAAAKLSPMPLPEYAKPPRYDGRLSKKGGFVWMSEMTLDDLTWWEAKKRESSAAGTQYSEKDGKSADTLAKWIAWRRIEPTAIWSGTRGDDRATAAPPSRDPVVHKWGPRSEQKSTSDGGQQSEPEPDTNDYNF